MKIIHQNGYTTEELSLYKHTVYKNLVDCAKSLVGAMQQFGIEPDDPANKANAELINQYTLAPDPNAQLDSALADAIGAIWKDPATPKVLEHSTEFYLMDSAP